MQVASDIFLGWCNSTDGHHFYVRQLSDMKGSADVRIRGSGELSAYAAICGETLAVAHARSGRSASVGGYLGSSLQSSATLDSAKPHEPARPAKRKPGSRFAEGGRRGFDSAGE